MHWFTVWGAALIVAAPVLFAAYALIEVGDELRTIRKILQGKETE